MKKLLLIAGIGMLLADLGARVSAAQPDERRPRRTLRRQTAPVPSTGSASRNPATAAPRPRRRYYRDRYGDLYYLDRNGRRVYVDEDDR